MKHILIVLSGVVLLVTGLVLVKLEPAPLAGMPALPYLLTGLGSGLFGLGVGELVSRKLQQIDPHGAKKMAWEAKDERNIFIRNQSMAKAYTTMIYIFGALIMAVALMNAEPSVILLLVTGYLFVVGVRIYYQQKLEREM